MARRRYCELEDIYIRFGFAVVCLRCRCVCEMMLELFFAGYGLYMY